MPIAPLITAWQRTHRNLPGPYRANATVGGPADPVLIPHDWLFPPLTFRPERPLNAAMVTQTGGVTVRRSDRTSQTEWGVNTFTETLDTDVDADAANLADHVMTFYATQPGEVPRSRSSGMMFNLNERTDAERATLLGVSRGTRIRIIGAPSDWPDGATELVVEGRTNSISVDVRWLSWWVAPVIGSDPGVSGPWFRWDDSAWDGTDLRPF